MAKNLQEVADIVAANMDVTKKDAREAVKQTFEVIAEAMANGETVSIFGFGKFSRLEKAARVARNPHNGEPIDVPAHGAPKFSPAKQLRESCK